MIVKDYSPVSEPSLNTQEDALRKGLGRSVQWAKSGQLSLEVLLDACVNDKRFDQQCEKSRSNWLWNIMQRMEATKRFRAPIFEALNRLPDERSANQLCEIAYQYADAGDKSFRSRLYEIVESRPVADIPWLGEEQIIALDGEQAFLFAARVRGERLATIEGEWDDGSLARGTIEQFGEERVVSLMSASTDSGIKRYYENWREQALMSSERTKEHRDRMQTLSIGEILQAAKTKDRCSWFRSWGMHADEWDLRPILAALWETEDPNVIVRLLRVFSNRPLPEFDLRLIELCKHDDEAVQRSALDALSINTDSAIREFAIQQLAIEVTGPIINLFTENFESGDEDRILESMSLPEEPCKLHWLLMDVLEVLDSNPEADCSRLALVTYGSTPCQYCRFDAARLLHRQEAAPDWLIEECRFDAEEGTRQLFETRANE